MLQSLEHTKLNEEMQSCIETCLDCHSICLASISHCLHMGGEHASPQHIRALMECAEICETSANFMLMGSSMHARVCGVCAQACERCATECERLAKNDEQMTACAEICRRCADSCHRMAA